MGAIKPPPILLPMNATSSASFFILRATDCHGDVYPLTNRLAGIDNMRHPSLEAAKAVADKFKADKAFRKELRLVNGWHPNTIRDLSIDEVKEN